MHLSRESACRKLLATMTHPAPISLNKVTHAFDGGAVAVREVTLQIAGGEFVSLVGPSGCGKSTLLRLIAGLMPPTTGEVTVGKPAAAPRVAFVFQDPTLLPWRTVLENVRLPLEVQGRGIDRERITQTLELVGLPRVDHAKFPRQLSGGMRMRVSLARAMVMEPDVLLLDEPFAALDDLLRQQLNEELLKLWTQQRWTAVFVTHNVSEAVFLSQRVVMMSARPGQIVADIPVPLVYPRSPQVRSEPEFAALVAQISQRLRQGVAA